MVVWNSESRSTTTVGRDQTRGRGEQQLGAGRRDSLMEDVCWPPALQLCCTCNLPAAGKHHHRRLIMHDTGRMAAMKQKYTKY